MSSKAPYKTAKNRVTDHMLWLLIGLIPAVVALSYFFGYGIIINVVLSVFFALIIEAVILKLRGRPIIPFLSDGSAAVTAALLAVAIPPFAPWWISLIGIATAIILAKHLYGGLGYNPFNPAMVAYVLLLISFPLEMSQWLPADIKDNYAISFSHSFNAIATGYIPEIGTIDTISQATPLDQMKTQLAQGLSTQEILLEQGFSAISGQGWEWINLAFLIGGLILIYRQVISWHIPTAMILSMALIATITWLIAPNTNASPWFHLFGGATMMGAFFIATDPVSGSTTVVGRLIFGAGVGLISYIIRVWGGYPDGVAFAVIIMNMFVPLIDYYTQPKVYGAVKK